MDADATGRFIAELRKQKGYTQKELAEKLMVTDKAVSRWETGKGLPDTSLLSPLGDALGVSVGELLAGRPLRDGEVKGQTDRIILESLNYADRMLTGAANGLFLLLGIALLCSPLFLTRQSYVWLLGAAVTATALPGLWLRKRGPLPGRAYCLAAVVLQGAALALEILPVSAVMVFATGPSARVTKTCSCFSPLALGYANVTPLLTGVLTVVILLLSVVCLFRFDRAAGCRNAAFLCSLAALPLSVVPLLLFGAAGMTAESYAICGGAFPVGLPAGGGQPPELTADGQIKGRRRAGRLRPVRRAP